MERSNRFDKINVRPSAAAWMGLAAGIAIYEALAPENELLTHQAHRLVHHENRSIRAAAVGVIGTTALHLLDVLPPKADPYHWIGSAAEKIRNRT